MQAVMCRMSASHLVPTQHKQIPMQLLQKNKRQPKKLGKKGNVCLIEAFCLHMVVSVHSKTVAQQSQAISIVSEL